MYNLLGFQRDVLYPNLNELVEKGLIEKGQNKRLHD